MIPVHVAQTNGLSSSCGQHGCKGNLGSCLIPPGAARRYLVAALHAQDQIGSTATIRRVQEWIDSESGAQGVPGGVPVDHWISKMLIQDPKGGASRSLKSYSEY